MYKSKRFSPAGVLPNHPNVRHQDAFLKTSPNFINLLMNLLEKRHSNKKPL